MYLEIFLADFAVFRVFLRISRDFAGFHGNTWISRVRDRAKYQKPCPWESNQKHCHNVGCKDWQFYSLPFGKAFFHKTSRRPYWCTIQWNGCHFGVQEKSCGNWTLFSCKNILLFQEICMAPDHLSVTMIYKIVTMHQFTAQVLQLVHYDCTTINVKVTMELMWFISSRHSHWKELSQLFHNSRK